MILFQVKPKTRKEQYRESKSRSRNDPVKYAIELSKNKEAIKRAREDEITGPQLREKERKYKQDALCDPVRHAVINQQAQQAMRKRREDPLKREEMKEKDKESKRKTRGSTEKSKVTWPPEITETIQKTCIEEFINATSNIALQKKICGICGIESRDTAERELEDIPNTHHLLQSNNQNILDEYNHYGYILDGAGLDGSIVTCCKSCLDSLEKNKLPSMSVANGMDFGKCPVELQGLTVVEKILIAAYRTSLCIIKLKEVAGKGTDQKSLRGNSISFPQDIETITSNIKERALPCDVDDLTDVIKVVFVGSKPPTRRQLHNVLYVRRKKVVDALKWLKLHHPQYSNIPLKMSKIRKLPKNGIPPSIWNTILHDTDEEFKSSRRSHYSDMTIDNVLENSLPIDSDESNQEVVMESTGVVDVDANTVSTAQQTASAARNILENIGDAIRNENDNPSTSGTEQSMGRVTIVPHGSVPVCEYNNPDMWTGGYPWLFPYGSGGPEDSRREKISFEKWMQYVLQHHLERFKKEHGFIFHIFNVLKKREVSLHTSMAVRHPRFSEIADTLNNLTSKQLENVLNSLSNGNLEDPTVKLLMKQIHIVGSKIKGFGYSKRIYRSEIQGQMIHLGMPAIFLTINPADVHSPIVSFLTGHDIDLDAQFPDLPNPRERAKLVADNPVACAEFFNIIFTAVISCLLRYGKSDGGILGKVSGYYGCVEEQCRGSLHMHMMIWLDGYDSPNSLMERINIEPGFKEKLLQYLETVIKQHYPRSTGEHQDPLEKNNEGDVMKTELDVQPNSEDNMEQCDDDAMKKEENDDTFPQKSRGRTSKRNHHNNDQPSPSKQLKVDVQLKSKEEREKYDDDALKIEKNDDTFVNKKPKKSKGKTSKGNCDNNDQPSTSKYSKMDVQSNSEYKMEECGVVSNHTVCDTKISKDAILTQKPPDPDDPDFAENLKTQVEQLIPYCNIHKHCDTCYKYGDNSNCRFDFPRKLIQHSTICDGEIMIARLHPWVNNYEEVCLVCTKCNMDIKFLGSGKECKSLIFYITEYQTKTGLSAQNTLPVIAGVVRNLELGRTSQKFASAIAKSKVLIYKCLNRITSQQELSAVHVASLLLGYEDKYASHNFRVLNILSFMSQLANEDNDEDQIESQSRIETGNQGFFLLNDTTDYMMRGEELRELSLYEYTSCIEKITVKSEKKLKGEDSRTKLGRPKNQRIMFEENHPQSRTHLQRRRSIPLVPRLTYFPPSEQTNKNKFSMCMLIMFKPFVDINRIKEKHQSWGEAFDAYMFEDKHIVHINRIREMHEGLAQKAELDEARKMCTLDESSEMATPDHVYYYITDEDEMSEVEDELHIESIKNTPQYDSNSIAGLEIICNAKNMNGQDTKKKIASNRIHKPASNTKVTEWKAHLEESRKIAVKKLNGTLEDEKTVNKDEYMPKQLDIQGCQKINLKTVQESYSNIIDDIIEIFTLNAKQQIAFKLIATNVINRLKGLDVEQKLVYLGGQAGTGKSQVIKAIKFLHEKLNIQYSLRLSAYTGTAAAEIHGSTLSSLAKISRNNGKQTNVRKLEQTWDCVHTLIVDEVSMVSTNFLAKLHRQLIKAKHTTTTEAFAGLDILFVGDFRQFSPIRATPLYYGADPNSPVKPVKRQYDVDRECGRSLWNQLTHVVILNEQNRVTDRRYAELLTRVSNGKGTRDDYNLLNTRLITNVNMSVEKFKNAPVVVPGNELRQLINRAHAKFNSQQEGKQLYISKAVDSCSKVTLTKSKLEQIHKLPYTQTGSLPSDLELFVGLPVILTSNIAVELGLTNGAFGVVTKIAIDQTNRIMKDGDVYVMEKVPRYVIVKFHGINLPKLAGLEDGEVPIFCHRSSFSYKFPGTRTATSINRQQLPLVAAYSYTSYKAQSKTLNAIVTDLFPPSGVTIDPSFSYVPLSRVRSLQDLVILRPFPISVLQCDRPGDLVAQENKFKTMDTQN